MIKITGIRWVTLFFDMVTRNNRIGWVVLNDVILAGVLVVVV